MLNVDLFRLKQSACALITVLSCCAEMSELLAAVHSNGQHGRDHEVGVHPKRNHSAVEYLILIGQLRYLNQCACVAVCT